jgi:hypothetical protein
MEVSNQIHSPADLPQIDHIFPVIYSRTGAAMKYSFFFLNFYTGCTVLWHTKQQFGNLPTHSFTGDRKHLADP